MRNLLKYPITKNEIKDCLQSILDAEVEKELCGDLTPSIIHHILTHIDEMWNSGFFDGFPFEDRFL